MSITALIIFVGIVIIVNQFLNKHGGGIGVVVAYVIFAPFLFTFWLLGKLFGIEKRHLKDVIKL